ncbi:MAG: hypothetical protein ABEJ56_01535 [Candidatus Nanohaloarchaea archaeon]
MRLRNKNDLWRVPGWLENEMQDFEEDSEEYWLLETMKHHVENYFRETQEGLLRR